MTFTGNDGTLVRVRIRPELTYVCDSGPCRGHTFVCDDANGAYINVTLVGGTITPTLPKKD